MKKLSALILAMVAAAILLSSCAENDRLPTGGTEGTKVPTTAPIPAQTDAPTEPAECAGGLLFQELGDGTCAVVGAGDEQEADLVIPANAPTGSRVVCIAKNAFRNEDWIRTLTIAEGVTAIGEGAFMGCGGLTAVLLPNSLSDIGKRAFYGCSQLTDLMFPANVAVIGDFAFSQCSSLSSVEIPAGVTRIGPGAFANCGSLGSMEVDEMNNVFYSAQNCIIHADDRTLVAGCKTSLIPADGSVTTIGAYAFAGAPLSHMVIPDCVTDIAESAFSFCTSLTDITLPGSLNFLGEAAFVGCTSLRSIVIPEGISELQPYVFAECVSLKDVRIPHSVCSMDIFAFYACTALERIRIPDGITQILENVFDACSSLKEIEYDGTIIQWQNLYKRYEWASGAVSFHIICTDGEYDQVFDWDRYVPGQA